MLMGIRVFGILNTVCSQADEIVQKSISVGRDAGSASSRNGKCKAGVRGNIRVLRDPRLMEALALKRVVLYRRSRICAVY